MAESYTRGGDTSRSCNTAWARAVVLPVDYITADWELLSVTPLPRRDSGFAQSGQRPHLRLAHHYRSCGAVLFPGDAVTKMQRSI